MRVLVLGMLVLCLAAPLVEGCGRGSIYIENNQYKQILIAIGQNVTEDIRIIDRLKEIFTEASSFLYQVTRNRAYLGEITILVPTSWSDRPEYEPAGKETIDKSDILIDKPDERFDHGHRPFVIKTTECGELGHYMHLTPEYVLDVKTADQYGPYDKVLIHEWSHLRYGVYDEYPQESGQHFYANSVGEIEATRCSAAISGQMYNRRTGQDRCDYKGNLPESDCRFRDNEGISGKYASLMYKPYLPYVTEFCDEDAVDKFGFHNREAPTLQNIKCNGKSVWKVLREHPDFERFNQPRNVSDTRPTFRVIRQKRRMRTVLVLDNSNSMRGTRLDKLGQACSNYISTIIRDGESLGVVWFARLAIPRRELTVINSETRRQLLNDIPRETELQTAIGKGILEGLNMLRRGGGTEGGQLIVGSDGKETQPPWIEDVFAETVQSGATLHSIAITNAADSKVDILAQATGGLSFLFNDNDQSNGLNEAFQAIGDLSKQDVESRSYTIESNAQSIPRGDIVEKSIRLDPSLGRDTEFIFDYSGPNINLRLTSPTNVTYNRESPECTRDVTFGIYRFKIPGLNPGTWQYRIANNQNTQSVATSITSKAAVEGEQPIIAQAFWSKRSFQIKAGSGWNKQAIYAAVTQGYAPVINADVMATVERPTRVISTVDIVLKDNGAGADSVKDDGIYSAYFTQMIRRRGRYNVKVKVNSNAATVVKPRRVIGQGAPRFLNPEDDIDIPVIDLERQASGGSYEVDDFPQIPNGKIYSPGQINDIRVTASSHQDKTVNLTWTAVGAELDSGTASRYDLRIGTSFDQLQDNFTAQTQINDSWILSGGSLDNPLEAGSVETFQILVPQNGELTYYFAVRAYDTVGRMVAGDVSPVAMASMRDLDTVLGDGPNVGMIVGIVIGVAAFIGILVGVIVGVVVPKHKRGATRCQTASGKSQTPEKSALDGKQVQFNMNENKNKSTIPATNASRPLPPIVNTGKGYKNPQVSQVKQSKALPPIGNSASSKPGSKFASPKPGSKFASPKPGPKSASPKPGPKAGKSQMAAHKGKR